MGVKFDKREGRMRTIAQKGMMGLMLFLTMAGLVWGTEQTGFRLEVLIDGHPASEYWLKGTSYVEAFKGKEYTLRVSNPLSVRAAVALSVDGLNTIDARHTDARSAHKWVLEPYQSIEIHGWQTSSDQARRFFFTSEEKSYGAWLGKTDNLGIISAVFFKEKQIEQECDAGAAKGMDDRSSPKPSASSASASAARQDALRSREVKDEYAATGIGDRINHSVYRVQLDLEPTACANLSIRYEFRPALARLGLMPYAPVADPLPRRQKAHGFEERGWCPEPR
jgi:hypothetical protein